MAAKDYKIACGIFDAYIAKISKRNSNLMLDDRAKIPEQDIIQLIVWWVKKICIGDCSDTITLKTHGKPIIEIKATGEFLEEIKEELRKK